MPTDEEFAKRMGDWVYARCLDRLKKITRDTDPLPDTYKENLHDLYKHIGDAGQLKDAKYKDSKAATYGYYMWVQRTIEDPDWT